MAEGNTVEQGEGNSLWGATVCPSPSHKGRRSSSLWDNRMDNGVFSGHCSRAVRIQLQPAPSIFMPPSADAVSNHHLRGRNREWAAIFAASERYRTLIDTHMCIRTNTQMDCSASCPSASLNNHRHRPHTPMAISTADDCVYIFFPCTRSVSIKWVKLNQWDTKKNIIASGGQRRLACLKVNLKRA